MKQTTSRGSRRGAPPAPVVAGAPPSPASVGRISAGAALLYVVLAVAWASPSSLSPADTVPNLGDPLHLAWVMAWDAHQLARDPLALFDSNSFYPYPQSLAFGDHLLPEALLVAPVYWTTGNALLASNAAVVAGLALSALAMFALVLRLTASGPAALLAGLLYAFNGLTRHELPRVHVLHLQWWPLALLFFLRFLDEGRRRHAALAAGCLLLQCLSGTYDLAYTLLLLPLWLAGPFVLGRRLPTSREVRILGVALALAAVPLGAVVTPYLRQFRALGLEKRQAEALLGLSPADLARLRDAGFEGGFAPGADLLSYMDPEEGSVLWGRFAGIAESELPHFPGLLGGTLAVLGAGSLRRLPRPARDAGALALATALTALLLSLGSRVRVGGADWGPGPYDLLHRYVPFARGMASPERFGVLVGLGGAILAGFGAARLLPLVAPRWRLGAMAAAAAFAVLEHWGPVGAAAPVPTGRDLPPVYRWLATDGDGPVIELPLYSERDKKQWAAYPFFSTYHWRPVPIGRTSFYPPAHDRLAFELRSFPDETSLALLERLGLRTVVVHPLVWTPEERGARLEALDAEPRLERVRVFDEAVPARFAALRLGHERVYRLKAVSHPPLPPCRPEAELPRADWRLYGSGIAPPHRVRDGDLGTSWMTLAPQRRGDHLQVVLPQPQTVSAIALEMAYPYEEFPRGLDLLVPDAGGWRPVPYADGPEEAWERLDDLVRRPREARIVLRFPSRSLTTFTLALGTRDRDWASPRWSVAELRAYRACR
ncbi:MAG: hypothetical protein HY317_01030 [Acidobacteria bacterium]|nr:hypothetical protein [Acidobacteriota bacterium]